MRRSTVVIGLLAILALGSVPGELGGIAKAEPGPIELVSRNSIEQATTAQMPALSGNGRFVAFFGSIGGREGLFRKDLQSGAIESVITATNEVGATEPSISASGRYVSFMTRERLDPEDDTQASTSDVYVADMATSPPTYELASARGGCDALAPAPHPEPCGLSYAGSAGSVASGRVSLSADGREVVFVTATGSDLTGPAGGTETPPFEVAVRDLDTDQTTLISAERDPLTGAMREGVPVPEGAVMGQIPYEPGASISADGSTVAWLGTNVPAQLDLTPAEAEAIGRLGPAIPYDEPLWRRVPVGGEAPATRRILSGELLARVVAGTNVSEGAACNGAGGWDLGREAIDPVPQLSSDGETVALIGEPDVYANLYLADMKEGVPALRALTSAVPVALGESCFANTAGSIAGSADIEQAAISADGERIALVTNRQQFPLAPPNLIGGPPLKVGVPELYLLDLEAGTLQRLTRGPQLSEPSLDFAAGQEVKMRSAGARSPSFDADGEAIAFSSEATNLVAGDGNAELGRGGSDVFTVAIPRSIAAAGKSRISSPPAPIKTRPRWLLTARATSLPGGGVRVAVGVPGAGRLGAIAKAPVGAQGKPKRIAATRKRARLASVMVFVLRAARRFAPRVRSKGGIEADLGLSFSGKGGKPLHDLLQVRFRAHARSHASKGHRR
jgi:Tol biopolymer transport system component